MATANEELLDMALRRAIGVRRFTAGEAAAILKLLEDRDREFMAWLRRRYRSVERIRSFDVNAWKVFQEQVKAKREEAVKEVRERATDNARQLAKIEAIAELNAIAAAIPVEIELASVPAQKLFAAAMRKPFGGGAPLNAWFTKLGKDDSARVIGAIQQGILHGETIDQLARRLAGTAANKYADGILSITRRNAVAVVRTGVNHVSNAAREEVWKQNSDVITALRWVSTLDGRTTPICRSRDGQMAPTKKGGKLPKGARKLNPASARPPAHVNCRSVMIAHVSADGVADLMGERPFVRDSRTRTMREKDFRAEAKEAAGGKWSGMSREDRNAAIRNRRQQWTREAVGQVPASTTYGEWLKNQPPAFVREVLGKKRADLFLSGKLSLDQFVDRTGNELSLKQLAKLHPAAF